MNMNYMNSKKGKRGKMMTTEGCHTCDPVAPPGTPSMNDGWPSEGSSVSLKKNKQAGKNRDRKSFTGGSVW